MAEDDLVVHFGNQRVRIPAGIITAVPWARQSLAAERDDGAILLAFVTNEPTVEAIATRGTEMVASFAVLMTPEDVRGLIGDLEKYAGPAPPA